MRAAAPCAALERNPLLFWRCLSGILAAVALLLLARLYGAV
jgi:hypothetical protein